MLRIWLKKPPVYAAGLCWCILLSHMIDRTAVGQMLAVSASGKIAKYQFVLGSSLILTLPIAWLFVAQGWGIYSVGYAMILTKMFCAWGRVWFARSIVGMSARHWLGRVLLPLVLVGGAALCVGGLPRLLMTPSFARIVVTTLLTEVALLPLAWYFVLNPQERGFVSSKIQILKERLLGGLT